MHSVIGHEWAPVSEFEEVTIAALREAGNALQVGSVAPVVQDGDATLSDASN